MLKAESQGEFLPFLDIFRKQLDVIVPQLKLITEAVTIAFLADLLDMHTHQWKEWGKTQRQEEMIQHWNSFVNAVNFPPTILEMRSTEIDDLKKHYGEITDKRPEVILKFLGSTSFFIFDGSLVAATYAVIGSLDGRRVYLSAQVRHEDRLKLLQKTLDENFPRWSSHCPEEMTTPE